MSDLLVASNITLNLQRPNSNVVVYAKQYDMISRVVNASLVSGSEVWDPPAGCEIVVMYTKPDGKMGIYDIADGYPEYSDQKTYEIGDRVIHSGYVYSCQVAILVPEAWNANHWNFISVATPAVSKIGTGRIRITLAEQALNVEGNVHVEISFYQSSTRLTTLSFTISVEKGVPNDDALKSDNYFNILSGMIQNLLGASSYPPQIDPTTRNWIVWNADKLPPGPEVTDYSSVGPQGIKGDKGDQGWSIVSVTPASGSGTHPKGGYDTYEVKTNNSDASQQLIATFQVYNGDDGEGAPGTTTPLKDNAVPQIGSSPAFAREDHVHPAVTPGDIGAVSLSALVDLVYPVGSIYMSVNNVSPETFLGGEWEQIEDKFLLASGELYEPGSEGGESSVTLTTSHLPAHSHGRKTLTGTIRFNDRRFGGSTPATGIVSIYSTATTQYFSTATSSSVANVAGFNFDASHEHSSVGENQPHNNMPPYLAVYMWQRIE